MLMISLVLNIVALISFTTFSTVQNIKFFSFVLLYP